MGSGVTLIEEGDVMMTNKTMGNYVSLAPTYILAQLANKKELATKVL